MSDEINGTCGACRRGRHAHCRHGEPRWSNLQQANLRLNCRCLCRTSMARRLGAGAKKGPAAR